MTRPAVHLVVGTRPEAVKLAPLAQALRDGGVFDPVVVATGQHPTMVVQALDAFDQRPDHVLTLDRTTGDQPELVSRLAPRLDAVLAERPGAAVVAQGDTTSALVGGLVGFWRRLPVVHLEAGLRSGDLASPFPEEANRRMLAVLADLHLAPTRRAVSALRAEGVPPDRVVLTGNTVVDAVLQVAGRGRAVGHPGAAAALEAAERGTSRLMLVTAHRRESWGAPLDRVLSAVRQIVESERDLVAVLPAHANPEVRAQVDRALAGVDRVVVTDPLPYPDLCRLLAASTLVLSDSGGIQEEAPSFGVPVLVLREVTERMEAVDGGWAELTGTDTALILAAAKEVLAGVRAVPVGGNPFGDGQAARRSAQAIAWLTGREGRPADFVPSAGLARVPVPR